MYTPLAPGEQRVRQFPEPAPVLRFDTLPEPPGGRQRGAGAADVAPEQPGMLHFQIADGTSEPREPLEPPLGTAPNRTLEVWPPGPEPAAEPSERHPKVVHRSLLPLRVPGRPGTGDLTEPDLDPGSGFQHAQEIAPRHQTCGHTGRKRQVAAIEFWDCHLAVRRQGSPSLAARPHGGEP